MHHTEMLSFLAKFCGMRTRHKLVAGTGLIAVRISVNISEESHAASSTAVHIIKDELWLGK